jgi:uncharacterized protein YecT (DUF1311 family)
MKQLLLSIFIIINFGCAAQDTCPKVKLSDFPKKDLPPANFNYSALKEKNSENYYYGIGVKVDYVTGRYLAFKEFQDTTNNYPEVGGASVLMMLYANGYKVTKNLDIAIRLACANVDGADAEIEYRVAHLKGIKARKVDTLFDVCQDITSGLMSGVCVDIDVSINEWHRKQVIDSLTKNWPMKDTMALSKLMRVAGIFFDARSGNEVDLSGTMRAALSLGEQDSLESCMFHEILQANSNKLPVYTDKQFSEADSMLNVMYKKVMEKKVSPYDWGTVTKDGIKTAERKWIPYRDAWVEFIKTVYPAINASSIETILTKQRTDELSQFLQ